LKVYLSYILFLALALRPVYNMGYLAYFELNIDYIVETYCVNKQKPQLACNGKCHLAKQLVESGTSNSKEDIVLSLFEIFVPVYFQENQDITFVNFPNTILNSYRNYSLDFKPIYLDQVAPPPQV